MSKFKVGDAVRVKAGSPWYEHTRDMKHPPVWWRGQKLIFKGNYIGFKDNVSAEVVNGNATHCEPIYLEPWNDAEEWDGEKWVPRKTHIDINYTGEPPATIAINGVKYVREPEKRPVSPLLDVSRAGIGIGFSFNGVKQDFIVQNYEHDYETDSDIATIKSITRPRKVGA